MPIIDKQKPIKFKVVDNRGDAAVTAQVSSIDWINKNICYVNEYNEEEVVPFDDDDYMLLRFIGRYDENGQEIYVRESIYDNHELLEKQ